MEIAWEESNMGQGEALHGMERSETKGRVAREEETNQAVLFQGMKGKRMFEWNR